MDNKLKKLKENNEVKSFRVDLVTTFIKNEVEGYSEGSTHKMYVDSNRVLSVCNGALCNTKISLKRFFFSWFGYKIGKNFLRFRIVEIEKKKFHSSKSAYAIGDVIEK